MFLKYRAVRIERKSKAQPPVFMLNQLAMPAAAVTRAFAIEQN